MRGGGIVAGIGFVRGANGARLPLTRADMLGFALSFQASEEAANSLSLAI
jgi:hypothetical protein